MSATPASRPSPEGDGRPRLSVMLITLDSERLLDRVLASVDWADEIVVVDSGSTDATEQIVRRHTPHFQVRDWRGFGIQKQRALEMCTGDWVLSLDSDEVVSPALRASIAVGRSPRRAVTPAFRMKLATHASRVSWFGDPRLARRPQAPPLQARSRALLARTSSTRAWSSTGQVGWVDGLADALLLSRPRALLRRR
jgi:glycosyltransferase involved in cell wall biosynthesis